MADHLLETGAKERPELGTVHRWRSLPIDDLQRDHADSALPDAMIFAGAEALDRCRDDLENYVPGETPDWDSGMTAVAVFRAMVAAAPAPQLDEEVIMRLIAPHTMRNLEIARQMQMAEAVDQHEKALVPTRRTARAVLELMKGPMSAPAASESKAMTALRAFYDACGGNPPDWLKEEYALAEDALSDDRRHPSVAGELLPKP